jgi:hypothetical protein
MPGVRRQEATKIKLFELFQICQIFFLFLLLNFVTVRHTDSVAARHEEACERESKLRSEILCKTIA